MYNVYIKAAFELAFDLKQPVYKVMVISDNFPMTL